MRKKSLFWKTWIMTFCSLLLTGCIFVFSYTYFAQRNYERGQTEKLAEYKQRIRDEISTSGIQREVLEKYPLQGCFIFISEEGRSVYPIEGEGFIFHSDTPYILEGMNIIDGNSSEYLSEEINVEYENYTYTVNLMLPRIIYSYNVFGDFVPAFMVIGFISTGLISLIYYMYFLRRIKRLNVKMRDMSKMEYQVTQRHQMGDELVELEVHLNEMYLRLQKVLEDRVFFTRGATHKLKTPLMAVIAMLEGMMCKVEGFEDRDYYLQECYFQMEKMTKLVNEILNLSQIEQLHEETAVFHKVMKELISDYEIMAQDKGCKITYLCDDKDMIVKIRENNLNKVLSNLLSNALKYAPENTNINIEMKNRVFSISNKCEELEQDSIAELCEPFVQGANASDGHGLGLYLVKTILEASVIEVEYLIEHGLFVVRIYLPQL